MEEPIGFVRDNPFVKNDTSRRFRRPVSCHSSTIQQERKSAHWRISPSLGSGVLKRSSQGSKENNMRDTENGNNLDTVSIGSESDIEYGPGIVEKLKAKFYKLSGIVSRDVKVSPHASGKRCPSMDDILTASEEDCEIQKSCTLERHSPFPLSSLSRLHSKSTSDMLDEQDERREFSVHRSLRKQQDDIVEIPSISSLRRKFEVNVQRRPSQNIRCAKMSDAPFRDLRIYPISVDRPHDQGAQISPQKRHIIVEGPQGGKQSHLSKDQLFEGRISSENTSFVKTVPQQPSLTEKKREVMFGDPKSTPQLRIFEAKKESTKSKPFNVHNRASGKIINSSIDDEPEFVKIGRSLRKNSMHVEEERDVEKEHRERNNETIYTDERRQGLTENSCLHEENEIPQGFLPRRNIELPVLSCNARITKENSSDRHFHCEEISNRSRDILSPPDPDSARQRPSSLLSTTPTVFVRTDDLPSVADNSPPPEEPKPPQDLAEFVPVVNRPSSVSSVHREFPPTMLVSPPLLKAMKSDSGVNEVQQLLSRFQRNRGERQMEECAVNTQPTGEPSHLVITSPTQRPFMPAVVGVRSSDGTLTCEVIRSTPHSVRVVPRPNVVSISVRDDAPSVIYTNQAKYDDGAEISPTSICTKRPAPLPPSDEEKIQPTADKYIPCSVSKPVPPPLPQQTSPILSSQTSSLLESPSRISLSSKYLEEKSKTMTSPSREKPYGDDFMELKSEPKETTTDGSLDTLCATLEEDADICSVMNEALRLSFKKDPEVVVSDSEEEDNSLSERPASIEFSLSPQLAGDGNPVRHSLISLVMEEDIPALMEAMSEEYAFEFVDLVESRPSSSSIIHSLETRKERRTSRQVDSIRFESAAPSVYTYLDEMSAISTQTWADGVQVDYDTYQSLIAAETAEYEKNLAELEKWKNSISEQTKRVSRQPADDDFAMGVTSRFTYPIHGENSTISV